MLALYFCLFLVSFGFTKASDPMKCTEVSVNNMVYGAGDYDDNYITSANFKLFYDSNTNQSVLQVSDTLVWDFNEKKNAQICTDILANCTSDYATPFNISVADDLFTLWAYFVEDNGMVEEELVFWYGWVDEGNINVPDGRLFTPDRACITDMFDGYRSVQCCNKFEPVPKAPVASNPKCQAFKSRVSVLNINDNFSINATSTLTINILDDNTIYTTDFNATEGVLFTYQLNNCGGIELNEEGCYLSNVDYKAILSAFVEPPGYDETVEPVVGRWISRNNQYLTAEGVPLTATNNCQYYNEQIDKDHVLSSQFCCQKFAH